MKKIKLLFILSLFCKILTAQTITNVTTLEGTPGDGTVSKRLLSVQTTGNPNGRVLTTNISWFPDPSQPPPSSYNDALNEACAIWAERITSTVPIRIKIMYGGPTGTTLAKTNQFLNSGTWYPPIGLAFYTQALENKLSNVDGNGTEEEFIISINSGSSISFFTNINGVGITSNQYDLLTVLLHEIGHGLGFTTMAKYINPYYGFPSSAVSVLDSYVENFAGTKLKNVPSNTQAFNAFIFGWDAFFKGPNATAANYGLPLKLWARSTPHSTSYIGHLDEAFFAKGQENALMSPAIDKGEVNHDIGNATLGALKDIGWDVTPIVYNIGLQIGKMNGSTFTTTGLSTILNEGGSGYTYAAKAVNNNGSTVTLSNVTWHIYAYQTGDKYDMLAPQPVTGFNTNVSLTLRNLDQSPVTWLRNPDGTIPAELKIEGTGSDGNIYRTGMRVAILQKPLAPTITVTGYAIQNICTNCTNGIWTNCSLYSCPTQLQITSPNSSTIKVYKTNEAGVYSSVPDHSVTATNGTIINIPYNYATMPYIKIEGINAAGTISAEDISLSCVNGAVQRKANTTKEESIAVKNYNAYINRVGNLHVMIPVTGDDNYTIAVYNTNGQKVEEITTKDETSNIDVSQLPIGMYMVTISYQNEIVYHNKVIFQK